MVGSERRCWRARISDLRFKLQNRKSSPVRFAFALKCKKPDVWPPGECGDYRAVLLDKPVAGGLNRGVAYLLWNEKKKIEAAALGNSVTGDDWLKTSQFSIGDDPVAALEFQYERIAVVCKAAARGDVKSKTIMSEDNKRSTVYFYRMHC